MNAAARWGMLIVFAVSAVVEALAEPVAPSNCSPSFAIRASEEPSPVDLSADPVSPATEAEDAAETREPAKPEEAVLAGQKALHHSAHYPWYNADQDAIQPVPVTAEAPPVATSASGGSWLAGLGVLLQLLAWILLTAALLVLVYLLLRAFLTRDPAESTPNVPPDDGDAARIESLPFPVAAGRLDLLAEARRHYQAGNYGAAIVYLFSFQLVQLDRRQIIRLAKGKTNRQYLREVGARAGLLQLIEPTMVAFEDVFFGNRTLERQRFESCWSRLDEFELLASQG